MRYSVSGTPDTRLRLAELAELLRGSREAFLRAREDHHWEPAVGSVAAADLVAFATTPGVRGSRIVLETAAGYLELAAGNCGGVAALYDSDEVFVSPPQLARTILECCARASWVLGGNPSDGTRNRLARAYIENDLNAEEAKESIQRILGKKSTEYEAAKREFRDVRAEIRTVFPATTGDDFNRPKTFNGQKSLGLTETVQWFFALLRSQGGNIDEDAAKGIYILLSNQTHPTLSAWRNRRRFIAHGDHFGTELEVGLSELERLTQLAVMSMYNALSWVYQYCGWDFDPDHEFEHHIDRTLPRLFVPPA